MSNRTILRLALFGLLAYPLGVAAMLYYLDDGSLDPAWEALPEPVGLYCFLENHPFISAAALVAVVIIWIAGFIGVALFHNWGRWLFVSGVLLALLLSVFTGPSVLYGWEYVLWQIASLATGAIMLAIFLPPMRDEFSKPAQQSAVDTETP